MFSNKHQKKALSTLFFQLPRKKDLKIFINVLYLIDLQKGWNKQFFLEKTKNL